MSLVLLEAVEGDITTQQVDAVVNAANSSLLGGGGVDGAIHAAAGPSLLVETRVLRRTEFPDGLPVGEAVATAAGDMPARVVVHAVGPDRHAGQTDRGLLAAAFRNALEVARDAGARTVAVPAIGAGAYGWDVDEVARTAVETVRDMETRGQVDGVEVVRFVLSGARALDAFTRALA